MVLENLEGLVVHVVLEVPLIPEDLLLRFDLEDLEDLERQVYLKSLEDLPVR